MQPATFKPQRGFFRTFRATRTFHISFDGRHDRTVSEDELIEYDGFNAKFEDGETQFSKELQSAVTKNWLVEQGTPKSSVDEYLPGIRPIRPADMSAEPMNMTGTLVREKKVPAMMKEDMKEVMDIKGDPSPVMSSLMSALGKLPSLSGGEDPPPMTKVAAAPEPVRGAPKYKVVKADETINRGVEVGKIRGMEVTPSIGDDSNKVPGMRPLGRATPDQPQHAAPTSPFARSITREGDIVTTVSAGNRGPTLEESATASVSGSEGISSSGAQVGRRAEDGRVVGIPIRTATNPESKVVGASTTPRVEQTRPKIIRDLDTGAAPTPPPPAPSFNEDDLRFEVARVFVPGFKWDKAQPPHTRVDDAMSHDLRSLTFRAILAVEDPGVRSMIIQRAQQKLKEL